ncbi:MAG: CYTH domain-containing protein [Bacillota bacterium]|nr:CYTH domain-containing protein [Bacillota bacterium]
MEIELKYRIPTTEIADELWRDKLFFHLEEEGSREEMCFDAKYYDTEDWALSKEEMAYRVRKEGHSWVASLKWKGHTEGALHVREELNVPVTDAAADPKVFRDSEIGKHLNEVIGDRDLICQLETKYLRKRFRIDTGEGIYELSLDDGWIITPYGSDRILEVELELFSGETDELEKLGASICERYGLEKEERSKYARGLELIKRG